ncbi:DUF418 domain-containing protein [Pedobacter gandavensis]|uniref:DUF418 domain-containing protein n=1 Tax=Pedobacter gandavensis TaxID=2679963 RepID=UPI00292E4286|nr:DUF418 domain-containing protein [Pedobacter gandavensis]
MNLASTIPGQSNRIDVVDAFRGFAVMAIFLVHNIEHFISGIYPDPASQPDWLNALDKGVFSFVFSLFAGKAYAIFALLFGFTFSLLFAKQQAMGKDFGYRFLWRLLLLSVFASLNALFFPGGDVLLLYCIAGVILFFVRKADNKTLLFLAVLCLLQPIEWYHYLRSLFDATYSLPVKQASALYGEIGKVVASGNLREFFIVNLTTGQKASLLWAIEEGRFMQTMGLFMCGLWIGRKQLFLDSKENRNFWLSALIISAIAFAPLYEFKVIMMDNNKDLINKSTVGVVMDMWSKFSFTIVLAASFQLLYQKIKFKKLTASLIPYGRMSLTNYVSQSILGALIYFPFGLSLAKSCGMTVSLLIGIVVFLAQVQFCKWWLSKHKQGPLEGLWARATWLK